MNLKREITAKGIFLGIVLGIFFTLYNGYLGLKVGRTSPSSMVVIVISMAILRPFKKHNILEHNMIQTLASAGEGVAAGAIFTLPALLMLGRWLDFPYWQIAIILCAGCLLGVSFSLPLRRLLVVKQKLPYPMGIASATMLKSIRGNESGRTANFLFWGLILGSVADFLHSGFIIASKKLDIWAVKGKMLAGFALGLDTTVLATGFISGYEAAKALALGLLIRLIYTAFYGYTHAQSSDILDSIRLVSIGSMATGGLVSALSLLKFLVPSISMLVPYKRRKSAPKPDGEKQRDIPFWIGGIMVCLASVMIYFLFSQYLRYPEGAATVCLAVLLCVFITFICTFTCAQIAGNSVVIPLSGVAVLSILFFVSCLSLWLGFNTVKIDITVPAILCATVACVSAVIGADNMQDLKAGHILGATPWKQQFMLILGGIASSCVVAPLLNLILNTNGFNILVPTDLVAVNPLSAPQATLIAVLASKIISDSGLGWMDTGFGCFIAICLIIWGRIFKKDISVMVITLGLYLPTEITSCMILGGFLRAILGSKVNENCAMSAASGLIAGGAITELTLSISGFFNNQGLEFGMSKNIVGIVLFLVVIVFLKQSSLEKRI